MKPKDLERNKIGISDLVVDIPTIQKRLSQLESFLNDSDNPLPKSIRERLAQYILEQMIDVGKIITGTPEFELVSGFYLRNFGKETPSYVSKDSKFLHGYRIS